METAQTATNSWVLLVGYLAWPITTLIIAAIVIYQIKDGLLQKLMTGITHLKVAGVEVTKEVEREVASVAKEAEQANIEVRAKESPAPAEAQTAAVDGEVVAPYDQIQDSWTDIAEIVTDIAVAHGGVRDQRKVKDNLILLADQNVIDTRLFDLVRSLQQVRNSVRRTGPDSVSARAAREYLATATSVVAALREKLRVA